MTTAATNMIAGLAALPSGPALTAALDIPETASRVSAVLPTYNRCPFDPAHGRVGDNPLTWALDTLLAQHGHALAEIVVVDDGSTDHTPTVLDHYARVGRIPVVVVRLDTHVGSAAARNAGIHAADGAWVLVGDDDCLYRPHYAAGAAYLMHAHQRRNPRTAAIMVPFYYRDLQPRQLLPRRRIGSLDTATARFSTQFHAFPAEYLPDLPRLDRRTGLLAPLRTDLIGGTALIDKAALVRAGGFADLSVWPTSYSDHLHLSADLSAAGGRRLYHCPDPRLGAAHLKFGAVGRYRLYDEALMWEVPALGRRFGELVELAAQPRTNTGCRVADDAFPAEMIGSFFAFFAGRSHCGAVAWAVRTWRDYVLSGRVYSLAVAEVGDQQERERAWRTGLERGARFVVDAARPRRTRAEVAAMLAEISQNLSSASLTPMAWRS